MCVCGWGLGMGGCTVVRLILRAWRGNVKDFIGVGEGDGGSIGAIAEPLLRVSLLRVSVRRCAPACARVHTGVRAWVCVYACVCGCVCMPGCVGVSVCVCVCKCVCGALNTPPQPAVKEKELKGKAV